MGTVVRYGGHARLGVHRRRVGGGGLSSPHLPIYISLHFGPFRSVPVGDAWGRFGGSAEARSGVISCFSNMKSPSLQTISRGPSWPRDTPSEPHQAPLGTFAPFRCHSRVTVENCARFFGVFFWNFFISEDRDNA